MSTGVGKAKDKSGEALDELELVLDFYPWHLSQKEFLLNLASRKSLHHAFLFYGHEGVGKFDFACALAAALLCEQNQEGESACGNCRSCQILQARTHPDFYILRPEDAGKQIKVDDVRTLLEFMTKSAGRSGPRIAIIDQCYQMNLSASNALLKFLEEPGEDVYLFLIAKDINYLLPTINSRCQKLKFNKVDEISAKEWLSEMIGEEISQDLLEYANGSPLLALSITDDPIFVERHINLDLLKRVLMDSGYALEAAKKLAGLDLEGFLQLWQAYCADMLKLKAGAEPQQLGFESHYAKLETMAAHCTDQSLIDFIDKLQLNRVQLQRGSNVNQVLCLQALLLEWGSLG